MAGIHPQSVPTVACRCAPWQRECVLTLDGGGIRGLVALLILRELMAFITDVEAEDDSASHGQPRHTPLLQEYFDYIFGTSTGGIIAIMLGRLNMTVDECIEVYKKFGLEIFKKKRPMWRFNRYDHKRLETFMKEVARANKSGDPPFQDPVDPTQSTEDPALKHQSRFAHTRVGVLSVKKGTNDQLYLFRSYYNRTNPTNQAADRGKLLNLQHQQECFIWEAARATSAAPTFFRPIKIGGLEYMDGGLVANNPSFQTWLEVNAMHRKNHEKCKAQRGGIQYFVSLGTGKGAPHDVIVSGNHIRRLVSIVKGALGKMTDPEPAHIQTAGHCPEGSYFRFNVENGLENIKLDEYKVYKKDHLTVQNITMAVSTYVANQTVRRELKTLATHLVRQRRARSHALAHYGFANGHANGHTHASDYSHTNGYSEAPTSPAIITRRTTLPEMDAAPRETEMES